MFWSLDCGKSSESGSFSTEKISSKFFSAINLRYLIILYLHPFFNFEKIEISNLIKFFKTNTNEKGSLHVLAISEIKLFIEG